MEIAKDLKKEKLIIVKFSRGFCQDRLYGLSGKILVVKVHTCCNVYGFDVSIVTLVHKECCIPFFAIVM